MHPYLQEYRSVWSMTMPRLVSLSGPLQWGRLVCLIDSRGNKSSLLSKIQGHLQMPWLVYPQMMKVCIYMYKRTGSPQIDFSGYTEYRTRWSQPRRRLAGSSCSKPINHCLELLSLLRDLLHLLNLEANRQTDTRSHHSVIYQFRDTQIDKFAYHHDRSSLNKIDLRLSFTVESRLTPRLYGFPGCQQLVIIPQ